MIDVKKAISNIRNTLEYKFVAFVVRDSLAFICILCMFWFVAFVIAFLYEKEIMGISVGSYKCPLALMKNITSHDLSMFVHFIGEALFFIAYLVILIIELLTFIWRKGLIFKQVTRGSNV